MYQDFYKLTAPAFHLAPDSRFFYGSSGHKRAIAHLMYGLAQQEGFIVITGEVGAGKTTLAERLATELDPASFVMGRIVTTLVSGEDLLRLVLAALGAQEAAADKATLLGSLERTIAEHKAYGRRCLLIVDEAQNLPLPAIEELRMLSNMTAPGGGSLQTILLGQPQFRAMLGGPELEQLRQRVIASYHLGPLQPEETRAYIEHRLRMVGWSGDPSWEEAAFHEVHRQTGGIPRRVNALCGRVLLFGALEEAHAITAKIVADTAAELARDLGPVQPSRAPDPAPGEAAESRMRAIEDRVARQERTMERMLQFLDQLAEATP